MEVNQQKLETDQMEKAYDILNKYFGFDSFRPLQAEIIEHALAGKDSLVLMPTGGGKSLCFQIPALVMEGTCIVLSPLISLMQDQVEGLRGNGVKAAFLNSSQDQYEQQGIERELQAGEIDILYVSPEKLTSSFFLSFLETLKINLIAIDEAHCISSWGHDFRPEYTQLSFLKERFAGVPIMALTATADRITREDILAQLQIEAANQFVSSFDRPNLSLKVLPGKDRLNVILRFIEERPGQSGIIYCLSRKGTEDLAKKLNKNGIDAAFYHAGMSSRDRAQIQQDFIYDRTGIICATIAFGMGIDKSNVRFVMHYNLPKNLESYYQEIGRAGRDGLASDTVLFFTYADVIKLQSFVDQAGQKDLQNEKLKRMIQYAESAHCRRKVLLGYFGDDLQEDCGNCDVCDDPPERFDGTIIAQKALSCIARVKERAGMNMIVDVLRGSAKKDLIQRGYDKIRTYGAGANISAYHWSRYMLQLLNLGLFEIAYDDHNVVKLTEQSEAVLFKGKKIELVRPLSLSERSQKKTFTRKKSKTQLVQEALFEALKTLRAEIAAEQKMVPDLIFTDATLLEMSNKRPVTLRNLRETEGVSEYKLEQFGERFTKLIFDFLQEKAQAGEKVKGSTYFQTYELLQQGKELEAIAHERGLGVATIYGHIAHLYLEGFNVDLKEYITTPELFAVKRAVDKHGQSSNTKQHFEFLEGKIGYGKIKIGMLILKNAK